jgi:hypothetical protein
MSVPNDELWPADASKNATLLGISSCTSVPVVALLEIFSPILLARSRMPAKPQCPSRPASNT